MLIEKEIISPGTYWYVDEKTGLPRKWDVTPEITRQLHKDGNEMVALGLPIPVPFEHDFNAHPMTPKEKLLNNAGEVKEYRLKGDTLWSVVDVQDEEVRKKVGKSIRWTSPWISSFTDGTGRQWNNVIAHLALTTRPRVVKQAPFESIAVALSLATPLDVKDIPKEGFCVSKAGRLVVRKKDQKLCPQYPMAFSLYSGSKVFADAFSPSSQGKGSKGGKKGKQDSQEDDYDNRELDDDGEYTSDDDDRSADISGLMNPLQDKHGDVGMEELLCDLLCALGVMMPQGVGEGEFKRALYEAAMSKIYELTSKAQAQTDASAQATRANTTSPAGNNPNNPLIQQEQQPMYMSLEDINKITDPTMKSVALSMYNENVKLRAELDANAKVTASLRDAKLKEAGAIRSTRVALLSKLSPKVKADLDAMLALPSMALSMGEAGAVVDPMAQVLAVLEKGLSDLPRLLTVDTTALSVSAQPTDDDMLTQERENELADDLSRRMGYPPEKVEKKKAS